MACAIAMKTMACRPMTNMPTPTLRAVASGQQCCRHAVSARAKAMPTLQSSTTATLAMGDAIACALMEVRHFKASDFALYHPGGSLGKKLLSKVKDYMVSINLPIVSLDTKVSDTIIEISKTKQGIAVALKDGKIAGVVTDGDVRRAMHAKKEVFFDLTVEEIMSKHPKMVNQNTKLSEAETIMRKYNIHSLVVVDDNSKLVGIIDSFACL